MDPRNSAEMESSVKQTEEKLTSLLSPIEPIVMRFQSLLVWEYPRRSAVMFICVHFLFWFLTTTSLRFYFLICSASIVLFFVDTWKKKIWPEIRVPPPVPDDTDEWTPVHPRLLSVPEISRHLAQTWNAFVTFMQDWRLYRRNSPKKFCFISCAVCILLALVGHYISGIMLSYILVMSLLLWPSVLYHNLLKRAYLKMEPAFMWLDYKLKIKMKRSPQVSGRSATSVSDLDKHSATCTEEDDDEFCPPIDPETTALLARAITDSEDEGGTPSLPTPGLSNDPSLENSEDENETEMDFTPSIERMPSFDDLDQTDDEFVPPESQGHMDFVPFHFGDNSDSDDDTLSKDLTFPEMSDLEKQHDTSGSSVGSHFSALTSALVSKTLSSMMESALQGAAQMQFGERALASSSGRLPGTGAKITYTRTEEGEAVDLQQHEPTILEDDEETSVTEADIEKEFDFLDDFDVEVDDDDQKHQ